MASPLMYVLEDMGQEHYLTHDGDFVRKTGWAFREDEVKWFETREEADAFAGERRKQGAFLRTAISRVVFPNG